MIESVCTFVAFANRDIAFSQYLGNRYLAGVNNSSNNLNANLQVRTEVVALK